MGRYEEAVKATQESIRLEPKDPRSHSNLADIYLRMKKYKECLESVERALKLDPNMEQAKEIMQDALKEMEEQEQAPASNKK
jgi:tetratricopeptide (TPR) repeat protein